MVISILLVTLVLIILAAYYTSAWFGCRSSGMTPLPPHYTHLSEPEAKTAVQPEQPKTTDLHARQPIDN